MRVVIRDVQPAEEIAWTAPEAMRAHPGSLEAVFREHYPRMVGMLARLTGDRPHAEDIAADVFCKLARRPAILRAATDVTAWVYRVAANAGVDALRVSARRRRREQAAGVERIRVESPPGALEEILRQERRARVRDVLADLKPREAQLLLLRSGGMAYKELARTLGVAAGSVGTLLARAEAEFERRYRARFGEEK
ncbi:MAG: sigma-70 family RNA polymerase sigma factor [Acidobacteriia bacterium]|nr:sigma-70 family RNA polymerase sigma factor [Terriglobia bacterium]